MPAKKKAPAKTAEPGELHLIRKLAEILNETGLSEIELDHKGARVRVSRQVTAAAVVHAAAPAMVAPAAAAPLAQGAVAAASSVAGSPLKSPMVGTAYLASGPDTAPFVAVGSVVKQGQTVLIIEAMKTMNQIPSPVAGKVIRIHVDNGDPVEYGAALVTIE